MARIVEARALENYRLHLEFEDGVIVSDLITPDAHNYLITVRRSLRTKKEDPIQETHGESCLLIANSHGDSIKFANILKEELNADGIHVSIACDIPAATVVDDNIYSINTDVENELDAFFDGLKTGNQFPDHVIYLADIELLHSSIEKDISQKISKRAMRIINFVKQLDVHAIKDDIQFRLITANSFHVDEIIDKWLTL